MSTQWGGEIALLDRYANLPYRGRAVAVWRRFMADNMRLNGCYRSAVAKVLTDGKWRAKAHPVAWVRRVAMAEALKDLGLPDALDDGYRMKEVRGVLSASNFPMFHGDGEPLREDEVLDRLAAIDSGDASPTCGVVGIRHAEDLDGYSTRDLSLFYNAVPFGRGRATYKYEYDTPPRRRVSPAMRGADGEIDWPKVCRRAGLDREEEMAFRLTKLFGLTREELHATAKDEKDRRAIQAAERRLSRKMQRVRDAICGTTPLRVRRPKESSKKGASVNFVIPAAYALKHIKCDRGVLVLQNHHFVQTGEILVSTS